MVQSGVWGDHLTAVVNSDVSHPNCSQDSCWRSQYSCGMENKVTFIIYICLGKHSEASFWAETLCNALSPLCQFCFVHASPKNPFQHDLIKCNAYAMKSRSSSRHMPRLYPWVSAGVVDLHQVSSLHSLGLHVLCIPQLTLG